jgi:cytochrome c-type biogenesis protein CcmH
MTHFRFLPVVHQVGVLVVLAAIALSGCNRNAEPVGKTTVAETPSQSAEYPVVSPAADSAATPAAAGLTVTVSLSPVLAKKAAPNDVVFIFARAAHGPRMPLAIVRRQVKDLPTTVVLDDSLGMLPEMKLSSVPEVVVVARVSKSGNASARAGDLEGMSAPVKTGAQAVAISIARVVTGNQP